MKVGRPINWGIEVIARWKRGSDGVELRLRRDGRAFFWFPASQSWKTAIENTTIDLIEQWRMEAANSGFYRLETR